MNTRVRQRGAALILMMVIVILGGAWWLVSGLQAAGNRTVVERTHNAKVLAEAKAALIAWAALNAATDKYPGSLPCPEPSAAITDPANAGITAPNPAIPVNTCTRVGRLPWRTLGIDKLQDAAGEPLWYVVDASTTGWALADNTATLSINSNKAGTITVDGNLNAAVAVIVAPGAPMTLVPNTNQAAIGCATRTQQRTPSAPNVLDYLECQSIPASPSVISLRTQVVDNASNKTFNDQMVVITAAEVLAAVEPVVAQRILKQVVPQMQSVYASSTWGASGAGTSAANPAFPFAVTFGDPGASPTSAFKGTAGKTEGLMPVTAITCSGTATGRCDPNFHTWNLPVSLTFTNKTDLLEFDSGDCLASTATQVNCTASFTKVCPFICFFTPATVNIVADAANVGLAMRTLDATAATGLLGTTTVAGSFPANDGSARITYTGGMWASPTILCGGLVPLQLVCGGSVTVTIPISAFKDHPFLNPTTADNWYWFFANNWHHVTYYAVAPLHTPGAAGNCSGTTCISVTVKGDVSLTGKRAVLALAGRSLVNTSGTNRALTDFLDGTENPNLARLSGFEQYKSNRTFNDRFVSLSP